MPTYDTIGDIAILQFQDAKKKEKLKIAKELLKRKNIKTVLEKSERVKGRLRTIKTRFIAGEKKLETIHKENNSVFKLNVESCYFSPRLAEDRKEISEKIKKKDNVLVMFSGVNPYGVAIAKKAKKVVSIELGRECCRYALENSKKNKLNNIEILQGDVKKVIRKGKLGKFEVIVMPRPNLKDSFLEEAFLVSKKGTRIFYYCFGKKQDMEKNLLEINKISKKKRKKIKVLKIKKAGDIAPYKFRWRIDFKIF